MTLKALKNYRNKIQITLKDFNNDRKNSLKMVKK